MKSGSLLLTVAALAVAGCSAAKAPSAVTASDPSVATPATNRDLRLATTPDADGPVVSDLEAGRKARPARHPAPAPQAQTALAALAAAPRLATSSVSTGALIQTSTEFRQAPEPVEEVIVTTGPSRDQPTLGVGGGLQRGGSGDWSQVGGRGPTVIIRGGRGGIDDDCDIHRPGIHGGFRIPTAIHSIAPSFAGRAGIR